MFEGGFRVFAGGGEDGEEVLEALLEEGFGRAGALDYYDALRVGHLDGGLGQGGAVGAEEEVHLVFVDESGDEFGVRVWVAPVVVHNQFDPVGHAVHVDASGFVVNPVEPELVALAGVGSFLGVSSGLADGGADGDDFFPVGAGGEGEEEGQGEGGKEGQADFHGFLSAGGFSGDAGYFFIRGEGASREKVGKGGGGHV